MSPAKRYSRLLFFIGTLVPVLALLGLACGSGAESVAPASAGGIITLDVSLGDNFFEPNQFSISAGQKVTFRITNNGVAIHNMRIDGPDGQYFTADDTVSDPLMVNGGGTAVLTWTAPQTGTYNFRCDFHVESKGTITVS